MYSQIFWWKFVYLMELKCEEEGVEKMTAAATTTASDDNNTSNSPAENPRGRRPNFISYAQICINSTIFEHVFGILKKERNEKIDMSRSFPQTILMFFFKLLFDVQIALL